MRDRESALVGQVDLAVVSYLDTELGELQSGIIEFLITLLIRASMAIVAEGKRTRRTRPLRRYTNEKWS